MKWIGQNIESFISRFRSDVYLENLGTSSETNILVVDSNGKITKNTGAGDDMTFQLEDDSGDEVTISDGKEVKIIGAGGLTTNWTDTDNGTDADPYDLTITAADFRVAGDSGVTAITLGDTVTIAGGNALTSAMSGDTLTVNHDDTSSQASVDNSGTSVIQDVTLDTYGHVTGLATVELEDANRPTKQLQFTYHNFTDDIDTTKIYLSLADADTEGTVTTAVKIPFTAPLAGKLMRVFLRANQNLSGKTLTWRLETQATGVTFGTGPTIVGTQSGAGCTTSSMTTYDFTSSLDSGDNVIDAGDSVYLSIQSDAATANTKFHVTCLWEWDMSSIG